MLVPFWIGDGKANGNNVSNFKKRQTIVQEFLIWQKEKHARLHIKEYDYAP
jgi:hypothetical protein